MIGETRLEIEAAPDVIMGRQTKDARTNELAAVAGTPRPADIVTLDYHLGHERLKGTDIAAALCEEGFPGVACIFSGGTEEDMAKYEAMPGVDVAVSKSEKYDKVAKRLLEKHALKCGQGE